MCEFLATPAEAAILLEHVKQFCAESPRHEVAFPVVHAFHTNCFLSPDDASKQYFKDLFRRFKKSFPFNKRQIEVKFSSGAHISVGRLLDASQIASASLLFAGRQTGIRFKVESLTLRRFNVDSKQYSDIAEFKLRSERAFDAFDYQLSLF